MVWSRATVADEVVEVDILIDVHFLTHAVSGAEDTCFRDSETQGDFIGVLVKIDQHAQQFVGGSERGEVPSQIGGEMRIQDSERFAKLNFLFTGKHHGTERSQRLLHNLLPDGFTFPGFILPDFLLRFSIGIFVSFCRLSRSSILCLSLWR